MLQRRVKKDKLSSATPKAPDSLPESSPCQPKVFLHSLTELLPRVFASATASAPDGSPHLWCPPLGTGTSGLAAATRDSHFDNGGAEHGPLRLNVPYRAGTRSKLCQRWELKTSLTGSSTKRSQQTLTKRLGLPGPCGCFPPPPPHHQTVPPNHAFPGHAVVTHESPNKSPSRMMESPVGTLSSVCPRGKQKAHPSSPPLTLSNSSEEECPNPLQGLGFPSQRYVWREVTFHVPKANFHNRGSDRQGPRLSPPPKPHCIGPFMLLLRVVGPLGTGVST
ncbi:hypothetical protein D4764_13G0012380 [Takifugu flavidus]|uniref:Uncharacterized protein n=1 Tax=Takifugu flavidus TaxID=433684 RepID=A0A5C6PBH2_9TELE|nr:hypothetical protein D4764_13G0012380 [Takifugu flavidus]